ncbi:MAG: amino acid permease [Planctomycetota bacterium]|nr:MAG: amino acid permease [Planctomycetota bacterium]
MTEARRQLGLGSASALVMANMIGTGVFTTSGFLLRDLGSRVAVLAVWCAGGLLAWCGALCYGALARRIPESGGEYLFLSRVLHPAVGYTAGWISLFVAFSAPLASAALAFAEYLRPWTQLPPRVAASALLVVLAAVHCARVRTGAALQSFGVALNVALILGFLGLAAVRHASGSIPPGAAPAAAGTVSFGTLAVALLWVSYSYSGWNAAVYVGGEVRDPERVLPRALLLGSATVTVLYLLLNAAFLWSAPPQELAGQLAIGRIAAERLGGASLFPWLISLALCTFVSSMMMIGPRILARMAADGYLPRLLVPGAGAPPRTAVAVQAVLALAMLWTATFEAMLTYVGFTLGLSTAATVLALVVLRRREGAARVPVAGWPWTPGLFLAGTLACAGLGALQRPRESLWGLASIAAGLLFWRYAGRGRRPRACRTVP